MLDHGSVMFLMFNGGRSNMNSDNFFSMVIGLLCASVLWLLVLMDHGRNKTVVFRCGDAQSPIDVSSNESPDGMAIQCPSHSHVTGIILDAHESMIGDRSRVVCECDK
jgi:hypothetical protein